MTNCDQCGQPVDDLTAHREWHQAQGHITTTVKPPMLNPDDERWHTRTQCAGEHCPIHNPSQHHMREWPITIRLSGLTERICQHDCGHPDPDSLTWINNMITKRGDNPKRYALDVHGCCGCCKTSGEQGAAIPHG